MIDSLLLQTDDVAADAAPDLTLAGFDFVDDARGAVPAPVAAPTAALDDAEAAAAVAATEAGHAHARRGAWTAALASLEHAAAVRDALVASGAAGPAVAVRGWCDVATVRLAAGDRAGAREAFVRARLARGSAHELPDAVGAALAELDAELAPGTPAAEPVEAEAAPAVGDGAPAGGLLWLDTAEAEGAVAVAPEPTSVASGAAPPAADPAPRIAAVDAAVALAHEARAGAAAGGWGARLRRLFRR